MVVWFIVRACAQKIFPPAVAVEAAKDLVTELGFLDTAVCQECFAYFGVRKQDERREARDVRELDELFVCVVSTHPSRFHDTQSGAYEDVFVRVNRDTFDMALPLSLAAASVEKVAK